MLCYRFTCTLFFFTQRERDSTSSFLKCRLICNLVKGIIASAVSATSVHHKYASYPVLLIAVCMEIMHSVSL